jgi:hypothetical protein
MTIKQSDYAAAAPSGTNALFERLRQLKAACGPNKHDLAIVLVSACILEGLDTRARIVGALRKLGLNYRHVAIILEDGTGDNPQQHRWQRDTEDRYRLHDEGQAADRPPLTAATNLI